MIEITDIPTALTPAETAALQAVARDKYVLEIGALLGYSTLAIAQTARRVVSVDPHKGYPADNPRPTWDIYCRNLRRYPELRERIHPMKRRWQDAFGWGSWVYPYEVVFMDLTGEYEDTRECLAYFAPEWGWVLKTIAVHDCGHPDWPGVMKAVEWMKKRLGPYHWTYEQFDRLGIFHYA